MAEKILAGIGVLIMVALVGSSAYRLHAQEAKAATAPKENCEQYYQEAIKQASAARDLETRRVDGTQGIKEGLAALAYIQIYQNCLARQNNKR